ncbi:MAG: hypothetical protein KM296_00025 [Brockia lithotrophica]|nr:hypothetical protein [Brockia lithotrophica]
MRETHDPFLVMEAFKIPVEELEDSGYSKTMSWRIRSEKYFYKPTKQTIRKGLDKILDHGNYEKAAEYLMKINSAFGITKEMEERIRREKAEIFRREFDIDYEKMTNLGRFLLERLYESPLYYNLTIIRDMKNGRYTSTPQRDTIAKIVSAAFPEKTIYFKNEFAALIYEEVFLYPGMSKSFREHSKERFERFIKSTLNDKSKYSDKNYASRVLEQFTSNVRQDVKNAQNTFDVFVRKGVEYDKNYDEILKTKDEVRLDQSKEPVEVNHPFLDF